MTDAERALSSAVSSIMLGRHDRAASMLDSIRRITDDTLVRTASRILTTAMLQYQGRWSALAEMASGMADVSAERNRADVRSWAVAFRNVAERRIQIPKGRTLVPLFLSAANTPMIAVRVNGRERLLWLDTGSSMSIIASDVAQEAGIRPLTHDTLEIVTATGRVPAHPASIARMEIGGLVITDATAMIVSAERMQVYASGVEGTRLASKIDGVIGFDILSRLDIRIDYVNRTVSFASPTAGPPPRAGRNLYWIGTPIVRMVTRRGVPVHFNLDTGAQESYSTTDLIVRTGVRPFTGERRLVGGFAGLTVVQGRFIGELHLSTAGQAVLLRNLLVFAPAHSSLVALDGILGSDVGRSGVVRIDATNGIFLLEAAAQGRGLRP